MTRMHALVSLTAVNDTNACIRVIDRWSMTRMHWVWYTLSNLHPCHWPFCIRVIDRSIRECKKAWCRHSCHWPMVNDTNALSVIYTQQSASVSLTNMHSCHWPYCIKFHQLPWSYINESFLHDILDYFPWSFSWSFSWYFHKNCHKDLNFDFHLDFYNDSNYYLHDAFSDIFHDFSFLLS